MSEKPKKTAKQTQALNKRLKERKAENKYINKLIAASKKERDGLLLYAMKRASKTGLYNPKEFKLTKYRRKRTEEILHLYGQVLSPDKYFFLKANKKDRARVKARADAMQMLGTKTGIFVHRNGYNKASIKVDRKRGELYIERSGKTKRGPTKGKIYRSVLPLASIDELTFEKDRLRALAKQLGPLKQGEVLTFKVVEDGLEGYHNKTYSDIELMINYLGLYQKTLAARVQFYRHIEIVKTKSSDWRAVHKSTTVGRKGRKARDIIRELAKNIGKA